MVRAVSEAVTLLKKHLKNKKRTHFLKRIMPLASV